MRGAPGAGGDGVLLSAKRCRVHYFPGSALPHVILTSYRGANGGPLKQGCPGARRMKATEFLALPGLDTVFSSSTSSNFPPARVCSSLPPCLSCSVEAYVPVPLPDSRPGALDRLLPGFLKCSLVFSFCWWFPSFWCYRCLVQCPAPLPSRQRWFQGGSMLD